MSNIIRLPGLIDIHVHLRDPGQTYKEDFYTGTCAALAGGVTTVFDMPNKLEPMFTYEKLMEKIKIAQQKAVCDFGLYFGTDGKNLEEFEKVKDLVVGLKVYLSLTTGKYVIENEELVEAVFKKWPKSKVLVVHAEGDRVDLAIKLASKYSSKLHITHVNTKEILEKIISAKKDKLDLTCDVTPHHLFLTNEYLNSGGFGLVKPALATQKDQEFLWNNLKNIDCIATDHAPHTIVEKKSFNIPAGIPGLDTMLPLLLTAVKNGRLTIDEIVRLTNTNTQKIFKVNQSEDTYVEIDLDEKYKIENKKLKTKCGWSPFEGWKVIGKVKRVFIKGTKVFENGKILVKPGFGQICHPLLDRGSSFSRG